MLHRRLKKETFSAALESVAWDPREGWALSKGLSYREWEPGLNQHHGCREIRRHCRPVLICEAHRTTPGPVSGSLAHSDRF